MRKGIYQIIDELKEKPTLTLSEINDICNEFSEDIHCINVPGAIIQFTSLTGNKSDLTDFKLPNTKETWIEIAGALAAEYRFKQPIEVTVEDAARGLEISRDDILSFLKIRNYIMFDKGVYFATVLGIEKGCVINTDKGLRLTEKCIERLRGAFTVSIQKEEKAEIETTIPMERTKGTMCRYAKLREMKDMFTLAAMKAESPDGKEIWIEKANLIQKQIDNLTDEEAMEVVQ